MLLSALTSYLPAAGLIGLALYQACNQADFSSAAHSLGQALTLFGLGTVGSKLLAVHETVSTLKPPPLHFQV